MNQLKTLKEYQSSPEWSVHVEERVVFDPFIEHNGRVEMCHEPICKLLVTVWLIPIKALKKTDTPGGPVWDGKVALDEYKCYKFQGHVVFIDSSRFQLQKYILTVRDSINKIDFSRLKPNEIIYHRLTYPFQYEPTPETEPPASV